MSAIASFSTDAASLSAVFAAWFAANPGAVSIDAPLTVEGMGVRVVGAPSGPPTVSLPTGAFSLTLADYVVKVFAVQGGQTGECLLDVSLGVSVRADAAITGHTLGLTGVGVHLRFDGEGSTLVDAVLNFLIGELIGKGETWPLPELDRILGLKASPDSVGTVDDVLTAVVSLDCAPEDHRPRTALTRPGQDFSAQVTATAQGALVQDVLTCVFRPVTVSETAHLALPVPGTPKASATLALTLDTPQIRFEGGKIVGSASTTGSMALRASAVGAHFGIQLAVKPTLSLAVAPQLKDGGTHVSLVLSIPKQHIDLPIPGIPALLQKIIGDVVSDVVNLVLKGLNAALEKLPIPIFELDNPYEVFGLDVKLSFGTLAVQGDTLVTQIIADTHVG